MVDSNHAKLGESERPKGDKVTHVDKKTIYLVWYGMVEPKLLTICQTEHLAQRYIDESTIEYRNYADDNGDHYWLSASFVSPEGTEIDAMGGSTYEELHNIVDRAKKEFYIEPFDMYVESTTEEA